MTDVAPTTLPDSSAAPRGRMRNTIQSLDRGLTLLAQVVNSSKPLNLIELAKPLGIEKSSVHRLMATLMGHGLIVQDAQKRYMPGPGLVEYAYKVQGRLRIEDLAREVLEKVAQATGENAHLAVLNQSQSLLIDIVSSGHVLAVTNRVGQAEPLYCTAVGKALLTGMENSRIEELFGQATFEPFTEKTPKSVAALIAQVEGVRAAGLARDDEEFRPGVRCLAAPVRDASGAVVAAIGISGPASRLGDERFESFGEIVKQASIDLSKKIGFLRGDES